MPHDPTPPSLYDFSHAEAVALVGDEIATRAYADLYRRRRRSGGALDALADAAGLGEVSALEVLDVQRGSMTAKHVLGLRDGGAVEAVRIRRRTGQTACISSQVGCAFSCTFCASGRLGLRRQLGVGEIVQQVLELGPSVNRVVFMGIGEPLHNYDRVLRAIRIMRDRRGLALPTSGMTISTIGIPRRLQQLREEHLAINLTISLHATSDEVRHRLIPGTTAWSIEEVLARGESWARRHNRVVTYVYLLLPDVNDTDADARRLVQMLAGRLARVNLMRWNPVEGGPRYRRADDAALGRFLSRLRQGGVPVTVRDTQGHDVDAACGQLWLRREDLEEEP